MCKVIENKGYDIVTILTSNNFATTTASTATTNATTTNNIDTHQKIICATYIYYRSVVCDMHSYSALPWTVIHTENSQILVVPHTVDARVFKKFLTHVGKSLKNAADLAQADDFNDRLKLNFRYTIQYNTIIV